VSGAPSSNWTNTVIKAAWTLLFVAGVAFVVWQLLEPLLPILLVLVALIAILRLAVGWFHRDSW
jgi:hypothetical protein